MRVLVVSAFPPWPTTDGARLILHHHLSVLAGRHEIELIAAGRHGAEPPEATSALDHVAFRWFGETRSGPRAYLRRRWRSLLSGEPADVFRVDVPGLPEAVRATLRDRRPDVLHLVGPGSAGLAALGRDAGVTVVHFAIDAWRESYGIHEHLPLWRRLAEGTMPRKVRRHEVRHLPDCDVVVVVAERDAAALRAAVPGLRVEVVPNGVDPGPAPAARRRDGAARVLGLHGTMSTLPNRTAARTLVEEVLPRVRHAVPTARARIVGRDPAPDVRRLRGPDVEVTGTVADARAELATIDVYVAAMTTGSGIKNKVLEAMAAGLPVVATSRALDGIGAGPGVVVADDVSGLADAAVRLLLDDGARRDEGLAGRRRVVERFTWEASAASVERIWMELVDQRRGPAIEGGAVLDDRPGGGGSGG